MSSCPSSATVLSTHSLQKSSSVRSPYITRHFRPSPSTTRFVSSASTRSSGSAVIATSAPSRAYITATARPIPESPPVINATFPSSLFAGLYRRAWYFGFGSSSASSPGLSSFLAGNGGFGSDVICGFAMSLAESNNLAIHIWFQNRGDEFVDRCGHANLDPESNDRSAQPRQFQPASALEIVQHRRLRVRRHATVGIVDVGHRLRNRDPFGDGDVARFDERV